MTRFFLFDLAEFSTTMDVIVKLHHEEVPSPKLRSTSKFQTFMQKITEHVPKHHNISFMKHLSICDLTLGPQFFKHIQFHYDMFKDVHRKTIDIHFHLGHK